VDQEDDLLTKLSQVRNLPLRERFWRTLESVPNLLDPIWAFELKTRWSNNIWRNFDLNRNEYDRTKECAALVAFLVPRIMDLKLIGCAIAMPALRYAAKIGLVHAVGLMNQYRRHGRTGFALLERKPQNPGKESPDYVSVRKGNKWELWSKRDKSWGIYYEQIKFDPTLKWLSMGHLQGIFDYKHVLPDGCIEMFEQFDETCAVVSRVSIASNAAEPRMGSFWSKLRPSDLKVECCVEVKPFKFAPTRRRGSTRAEGPKASFTRRRTPEPARETGVKRPALGPPHTACDDVHVATVHRYETRLGRRPYPSRRFDPHRRPRTLGRAALPERLIPVGL